MNYDKGKKREKKRVQFVKSAKRSVRIGENSLHSWKKSKGQNWKKSKVEETLNVNENKQLICTYISFPHTQLFASPEQTHSW